MRSSVRNWSSRCYCKLVIIFQHNTRTVALLCCCSKLAARASITPAHTSPSVPIISSSSSSIICHLEWSWKLAFHPGVVGNTRPPTSGSRFAPYALRAHPRGRVAVYGPRCYCARRYAPASLRLLGLRQGDGTLLRGDPALAPLGPRSLTVRGSPPPLASPSPARRLHIWVTFGYGMCCGCLRYDTGPVSAALRPREPASLLCAIKRLSLLGGWINYLPHFQLRDPYSRFIDSSQHLIQIFVMLTCIQF